MGEDATVGAILRWIDYAGIDQAERAHRYPGYTESRETALQYVDNLIQILAGRCFDELPNRDAYVKQFTTKLNSLQCNEKD